MGNEQDKPSGATDNVMPLRPARPCPECGKPSQRDAYPFCSPRCRSVDLNRWLSGSYVIAGSTFGEPDPDED